MQKSIIRLINYSDIFNTLFIYQIIFCVLYDTLLLLYYILFVNSEINFIDWFEFKFSNSLVVAEYFFTSTRKIIRNRLEQVEHYTYLGQLINRDGSCKQEIKRTIAIAKSSLQ